MEEKSIVIAIFNLSFNDKSECQVGCWIELNLLLNP